MKYIFLSLLSILFVCAPLHAQVVFDDERDAANAGMTTLGFTLPVGTNCQNPAVYVAIPWWALTSGSISSVTIGRLCGDVCRGDHGGD